MNRKTVHTTPCNPAWEFYDEQGERLGRQVFKDDPNWDELAEKAFSFVVMRPGDFRVFVVVEKRSFFRPWKKVKKAKWVDSSPVWWGQAMPRKQGYVG